MSASQVILLNALLKGSQLPSVGTVTLLQRTNWEYRDEIQFSSIHYKKPILLIKVSAFTDSYSSQDKQTLAHQCGLHPWIRGLYEQTSCKNKCVFRECIVSQSYSIACLLFWQGQREYCKKEYYFSFHLGLTEKCF